MNRYLVLTLLGIVVLASGLLVGCDQGASPKPFPPPESEGEEMPATIPDSQKSVPQAPKIYEYEIPHTSTIPNTGMIFGSPGNSLKFRAETGNRVEGEVIVNEYYLEAETFEGNPYSLDYGFVFDPCNNSIVRRDMLVKDAQGNIRQYPKGNPLHWQFTFIAATTGEYEVQAFIECPYHEYITNPPSVVGTIKVTVYSE